MTNGRFYQRRLGNTLPTHNTLLGYFMLIKVLCVINCGSKCDGQHVNLTPVSSAGRDRGQKTLLYILLDLILGWTNFSYSKQCVLLYLQSPTSFWCCDVKHVSIYVTRCNGASLMFLVASVCLTLGAETYTYSANPRTSFNPWGTTNVWSEKNNFK